ncbi:hypothetical protein T439DRAFT_377708 [Meredithblackwellia eburnea MCA 4105]
MSTPRSAEAIQRNKDLAVRAQGRNIVNCKTGEPFFWLGDTAWELPHRLSKDEAKLYLENRAKKGFNVVMIVLMAEHGGLDFPSRDGHFPFLDAESSTKEKYVPDVTKINPKYFDFVDWVVDEAAKLGIITALVPTWGRYWNYGYYPQGPLLFDEENIKVLGEYVGDRYPYLPYITGGDSNRFWSQNTITTVMSGGSISDLPSHDSGAVTEALAASLIAGQAKHNTSEQYRPFLTYHPACMFFPLDLPASSADFYPESDWLSLDVVQSGHMGDQFGLQGDASKYASWKGTSSYLPVRHMYGKKDRHGNPRPVMDMEGHYESTPQGFDYKNELWNEHDIRNGAFQAIMAGATGLTYGVNSIWQMHNPTSTTHPPIAPPTTAANPWYSELDLPGAFGISYIKNLITSLPSWHLREPDQSVILSATHEGEGDRLVSAVRSSEKTWALVHCPFGEPVTVSPTAVGGTVGRAEWFNPRNEERSEIAKGSFKVEGEGLTFTPPSAGTVADDWVLILFA